jgi:hypothetical protein
MELPLFVPCSNRRAGVGENRDKTVVRASSTLPRHLAMFRFLGRMLGIAMRTGVQLALDIGPAFWAQLCGHEVRWDQHVAPVDAATDRFLKRLSDPKLRCVLFRFYDCVCVCISQKGKERRYARTHPPTPSLIHSTFLIVQSLVRSFVRSFVRSCSPSGFRSALEEYGVKDDRRAIVVVLNDNSRVRVGINGAWEDEEKERTKLGKGNSRKEGGGEGEEEEIESDDDDCDEHERRRRRIEKMYRIPFSARHALVAAVKRARIESVRAQTAAVREGLGEVIPLPPLRLLTAE